MWLLIVGGVCAACFLGVVILCRRATRRFTESSDLREWPSEAGFWGRPQ